MKEPSTLVDQVEKPIPYTPEQARKEMQRIVDQSIELVFELLCS